MVRPFISKLLSVEVAPWLMMLPPAGFASWLPPPLPTSLALLTSWATPGFRPITCVKLRVTKEPGSQASGYLSRAPIHSILSATPQLKKLR